MDDRERTTVLVSLLGELRKRKGWGGETHVQKAAFFLERMLGVPLGVDFVMYRYGPFSFELSSELSSMVSDRVIKLVPQPPYGPQLDLDEGSYQLREQFNETVAPYAKAIEFVAEELGDLGVVDLEPLSTALFVTPIGENGPIADPGTVEERVNKIRQLKPHITAAKARWAVRRIDDLIAKSRASQAL